MARTASTAIPPTAALWRARIFQKRGDRATGAEKTVSTALDSASAIANPRIDEGVHDIHHQVDKYEQRREGQHDPLHQGVVAREDGVYQQLADPRPAENRLCEHGASQEGSKLEAHDCDHG